MRCPILAIAYLWWAVHSDAFSPVLRYSPSSSKLFTATTTTEVSDDNDVVYYSPTVPNHRDNRLESEDASVVSSSVNEYSFFDQAVITVRAGSGGQGASTYQIRKRQQGPPDGGNGGRGGSVYLVVDPSLNTLAGLTFAWRPNSFGGSGAANQQSGARPKHFRAENGHPGQRMMQSGSYGKDVVVRVPPGTKVQVEETTSLRTLGTVTHEHPQLLVARGGEGGEGTGVLRSGGRGVRRPRVSAEGGERQTLHLTLQLVADVALVGVPNAGKSTFLAAVTRCVSCRAFCS